MGKLERGKQPPGTFTAISLMMAFLAIVGILAVIVASDESRKEHCLELKREAAVIQITQLDIDRCRERGVELPARKAKVVEVER